MKNIYLILGVLASCSLSTFSASAQNPADNDPSFDPGDGAVTQTQVFEITEQPDGKILIGGGFTMYDGIARERIARLDPDGTLDLSFDPGSGADGPVESIVVQPDGKILVGGVFSNFNGMPNWALVRLNADGSIDDTFDTGTGLNGNVFKTVLLPDGKIMIGGGFTEFNGNPVPSIARLNADGSLDNAFVSGAEPFASVLDVVAQPDGKILICGHFLEYNGIARSHIARLDTIGGLDMDFDPGTGAIGVARSLALQPDGKVLLGGDLSIFDGNAIGNIVRLNSDGSMDADLLSGTGADDVVMSIALQPDGKILISGQFNDFDGTTFGRVGRLNADGSPDTSFDPGPGANSIVAVVALQADGKILIGGYFFTYSGVQRKGIARLGGDPDTAIPERESVQFELSPNPTSDILNLNFSTKAANILIHDLLGAQVLQKPFAKQLDLSPLDAGVYQVSLTDKYGRTLATEQLVKQ